MIMVNVKNEKERSRESWIDVLKGMGIIMVCLGHLSPNIFIETHIYSFHMPLFFFISGYLLDRSNATNNKDYIKKKAKGLIIPYLFYAILSVVIGIILQIISFNNWRGILSDLLFLKGTVGWNAPLWFLVVLFFGECLYYLLYKSVNFKYLTILIAMIGIVGWIFQQFDTVLPFGLHIVPVAITFIHIGVMFKKGNLKEFLLKRRVILIGVCIITNIIFGYVLDIRISVYHQDYGNYLYFYVAAVSGMLLYSMIALTIKESRFLEMYGRNSLIILGTQYILFRIFYIVQAYLGIQIMYTNNLYIATTLTVITIIVYYFIIRIKERFESKIWQRL